MLVQLRLADIPAVETGRIVEVRWLTFLVFLALRARSLCQYFLITTTY
jgi:hypothetical protein